MIRSILQLGNEQLRMVSEPVSELELSLLSEVCNDLEETQKFLMTRYNFSNSAGICAVQIGVLKRVCLTWLPETGFRFFANPEVSWQSSFVSKEYEGCLSFFSKRGLVPRPTSIQITYRDRNYEKFEEKLEGLAARILLHEIDHMDGILFPDRMDSDDRLLNLDEYQDITHDPDKTIRAKALAAELAKY